MEAACIASFLLAASTALSSAPSGGLHSVARLARMEGSVLISSGTSLASASGDERLWPDSRVLTTSTAVAFIEYDNGCVVGIGTSQRYVVRADITCEGAK